MYLFSPGVSTGETCTVLGHLEFEQTGLGADTSNGANLFYYNNSLYISKKINSVINYISKK